MDDFKQNWDNYKALPVRQFDLIMADILDMLVNKGANETRQYVRGLRDGNRFAREHPEIKQLPE